MAQSPERKPPPPWESLPTELLDLVFGCLPHDDVLACGHVCLSWQDAFIKLRVLPGLSPTDPLLLLTNIGVFTDENGDYHRYRLTSKGYCIIFNPQTVEIYKLFWPGLRERWFCGSDCGWLATIGFNAAENIFLLNPFSGARVMLPPPGEDFKRRQYSRFSTSDCPLEPNCIIAAVHSYGTELSFCRPRDESWTRINVLRETVFVDSLFYKGDLYAVDHWSRLFRISFGDYTQVKQLCKEQNLSKCNYLVVVEKKLVLVKRISCFHRVPSPDLTSHETIRFTVFDLLSSH